MPYDLDVTGQSPDNLVENERRLIPVNAQHTHHRIIIPTNAPYFASSMQIALVNGPSVTPLNRGEHWQAVFKFQQASHTIGIPIYAGISIIDPNLSGEINILQYQTLGGNWIRPTSEHIAALASLATQPTLIYWENLINYPEQFPVVNHPHEETDLIGLSEVVEQLEDVVEAIENRPAGVSPADLAAHISQVSAQISDFLAALASLRTDLEGQISDVNDRVDAISTAIDDAMAILRTERTTAINNLRTELNNNITSAVNSLNSSLTALINALDTRLDTAESEITQIANGLSSLTSTVNNNVSRLVSLESWRTTTNGRLSSIESINATQDTNISNLAGRITAAENVNTTQTGDINSLSSQLSAFITGQRTYLSSSSSTTAINGTHAGRCVNLNGTVTRVEINLSDIPAGSWFSLVVAPNRPAGNHVLVVFTDNAGDTRFFTAMNERSDQSETFHELTIDRRGRKINFHKIAFNNLMINL